MKVEEILVKRGYTMTDNGECFNPKGQKISGIVSTSGYLRSAIKVDGKHTQFKFHRFMGYLKFGDRIYQQGMQIRHLDGNPQNNSRENIEIGTQRDNSYDIPKEKRLQSALKATQKVKRYSDEDVIKMKEMHNNGVPYSTIMKTFGISSKGTLSFIINKRYCLKH